MKRILAALLAGALFGVGLVVGKMTDPHIVLGFLDVAGAWDPTLLCVMLGATGTTAILFRFVLRRDRPVLDADFHLPTYTLVDRNLVVGAVIFGVGWGLAGYCPGPVLVGAAGGAWTALVFVPAMLVGAVLQRVLSTRRAVSPA